ncbi:hypothetical protein VSDG_03888 [Cytospora chrysosperma]|uniref:Uncharacterized protein n=1 Tax=Cytospora chrysosperma TaxID=252740 RepID=A0A423W7A8_CYTCH|nr:hypothetical protein VSDG_03888 [Valsa sordida]
MRVETQPEPDFGGVPTWPEALVGFFYLAGVAISLFLTIVASCHGIRAPWVPAPFYTDGILVWFVPVATVLPILLWPASLVAWGIVAAYRKASAAEAFCGVSRGRLRREYRKLRGRWAGGYQEVDLEEPRGAGGIASAELMVVASLTTDDEGRPGSPVGQQPSHAAAGDKMVHDERVSTTPTSGPDVESVESEPPAYRP